MERTQVFLVFFNQLPKVISSRLSRLLMLNSPNKHEVQCTSECTRKAIQITSIHGSRLHDKSKIKQTSKGKSLKIRSHQPMAFSGT